MLCQACSGAALAGIYMPGLKGLADHVRGPRQGRFISFYTASFTVGGTGTAAFVVKLGPGGSPIYSVLAGGAYAAAAAVAVDANGSAYVTGVAGTGDFPTTDGAFDRVVERPPLAQHPVYQLVEQGTLARFERIATRTCQQLAEGRAGAFEGQEETQRLSSSGRWHLSGTAPCRRSGGLRRRRRRHSSVFGSRAGPP